MALNYSVRPMFPAHLPEDNMVSPMRISNGYLVEGIPERSRDGFSRQWQESQDRGDSMDWETVLPEDPFGMDIDMNISSTVTAITDFLESLDYGPCGRPEVGVSKGDCSFFAELNLLFSKAMDFPPFPGSRKADDKVFVADTVDAHLCEELGHLFCDGGLNFSCTMDLNGVSQEDDKMVLADRGDKYSSNEELGDPFCDGGLNVSGTMDLNGVSQEDDGMVLGNMGDKHSSNEELGHQCLDDKMQLACAVDLNKDSHGVVGGGLASDSDGGAPPQAWEYILHCMGVQDLLNVERVCKSLRSMVQSDPLAWESIHIDQPLNERITDDILIQLTDRAQGKLKCLNLVECQRITDDGLKRILESNPKLTKLSVPGCTRLSIEGVLSCLRAFKSVCIPGINSVRIGGFHGVTQEHFDELMLLLGIPNHAQANHKKPLYYKSRDCYVSCDDERAIDIEMCPRCQKFRLIYDCWKCGTQCRACTLCIPRCAVCGTCFKDGEYGENFCLELYCKPCWKKWGQVQDKQDIQPSSSPNAVAPEPVSSFHG